MKIAITDANIFIDLIKLQLLQHLFAIDLEIITTQEVYDELYDWQQAMLENYIQSSQLSKHSFSVTEWEEINILPVTRGLTKEDITVAYLAKKINAIVLSGDNPLRKHCVSQKLDVKGIIWLLDTFLEYKHLTKAQAHENLNALLSFNQRLPRKECEDRLKLWSQNSDS